MEGRKLQLTGGSTYVVSLPKRWVTDAGLKAGDTVFLEPRSTVQSRFARIRLKSRWRAAESSRRRGRNAETTSYGS